MGKVTPAEMFFNRRQILHRLGLAALGLTIAPSCARVSSDERIRAIPALAAPDVFPAPRNADIPTPTAWESFGLTPREMAASHNNFYEFLPGRGGDVGPLTTDFEVIPWRLEITGACHAPRTLDLEALFDIPHEERLYHFRCVERWAMNVPWTGFPLRRLLELVKPTDKAQWVRFVSAADPKTMPGITQASHYPWPYHEALRLDEAMHDLTFVATGAYGEPLPKQHGAPVRLVVPWKYGYKGAKSLVKIEFLEEQPPTFWSTVTPHEYGILSNVNPYVPHPRWNQDVSFWLTDDELWPTGEHTFPTPLFNGYEAEVASLYPDEPREPQIPLRPGAVAR